VDGTRDCEVGTATAVWMEQGTAKLGQQQQCGWSKGLGRWDSNSSVDGARECEGGTATVVWMEQGTAKKQ
jgi:hypothetical protein